ncbi:tRNA dihydrouridine synthase [Pseudozyma hubeiensis SY62]|uniref:dolichol kinase n=1 Tax=Pseudozyma hubeiensis (strain SY62) TaxID=1305764 RepID=R9PAI3_PSEHS|nr:tRNA dihydrouridine synthase [Pseudozyma hubeiensis SY62]GAC98366.1 tRNA dihydrouridine synthase [Pseudozyma hubeiensis SY62]
MQRSWSTDSVSSIPEQSLPDPSRLRRAARRLSNQAPAQGAREWRKSRLHHSNVNATSNGNANVNSPSNGANADTLSYPLANAKAGPSSRRLSHGVGGASTAQQSKSGNIRRRNILDSAASTSASRHGRLHSYAASPPTSSPQPASSPASSLSAGPTASGDVSGSSTDRPTRRHRSDTVTSKDAYSADPSADNGGGYSSSSEDHSSGSDYEPFDWDVGRKRHSSDRPRSTALDHAGHRTFANSATSSNGHSAASATAAAWRASTSTPPPYLAVPGSGSDLRSTSRSTKSSVRNTLSPRRQPLHLASDSSANGHASSRLTSRPNRKSILSRALGAAGLLSSSTTAVAEALPASDPSPPVAAPKTRRGSQDKTVRGNGTTAAGSSAKTGTEAARSSSASNAAGPTSSKASHPAAPTQSSSWSLASNWRRLRINPCLEALLTSLASCIAYYGLKQHHKRETQSHAAEVGFVTLASTLFFFLRDPDEQSAIWATDHRNYRSCREDGVINALLLPPLLACATLFSAIQDQAAGRSSARASGESLPNPPWLVEGPPVILGHNRKLGGGMTTLVVSRHSLVSMMCLTSTVLLCHLLATKWIRRPHQFSKSNWTKLRSFTAFSTALAIALELVKDTAALYGFPLWSNLARWEVVTAALFYQANLYTISRLARKSFTLGELGIVAAVGVTLTMETLHLFVAKLLPVTTPYVKTFRRPTPLLIFQLALIVGTFIVGFLLSPLLYLSRNLAQKPTHRLRWPDKRDLHRRLLAAFFYLFATIYVVGVLGMWVRWLLVRRDPWVWTFSFMLKGAKPWSRPVLVSYWVVLISVSISCWQAVVARAKRFRSMGNSYQRTMLGFKVPVGMAAANNSAAQLKLQQQQQQQQEINNAAPSDPVVAVSPSSHAPGGAQITAENIDTNAPLDKMGATANVSHGAGSGNGNAINGSSAGAGEAKRGAGVNLKLSTLSGSASLLAKEHNTAAIKKASYLSLNARRKFFHALAVLLFVPGIALDPALTHLAFSLAFSIFIFAEYVRYYALYPFGAALHVFISEFLDHKDSGPVILSHFYLLTGCAGPLWLEGHSRILQQTGVLVLGVGDSLASVVGRRYGRTYWPGGSSKTVEGTVAFITSIMASAWLLRLVGWCEKFDSIKYFAVVTSLGLLEGVSDQHDNLVLPIFGYIVASLVGL